MLFLDTFHISGEAAPREDCQMQRNTKRVLACVAAFAAAMTALVGTAVAETATAPVSRVLVNFQPEGNAAPSDHRQHRQKCPPQWA
jgi:hypothetical protein